MYALAASTAISTEDELEEARARAGIPEPSVGATGLGLPGDDFGRGAQYPSDEQHADALV